MEPRDQALFKPMNATQRHTKPKNVYFLGVKLLQDSALNGIKLFNGAALFPDVGPNDPNSDSEICHFVPSGLLRYNEGWYPASF